MTIHFYALCIILGVAFAIWLGEKRYRQYGGNPGVVSDLAIWVVPAGVIGGRIYHIFTSPEYFFGKSGNLIDIFKIYQGGLGIWGAITLGGIVAYWRYQKLSNAIPFAFFMDALAPGILIAQGIGRFGNWFNGELFGSPTTLPWALEIPRWLRPTGFDNFATYHPTFLYEALCNFLLAGILIYHRALKILRDESQKNTKSLRPGSIFILYVAGYCTYRFFIEGLRIDSAHNFMALRLNQWVSLILGVSAFIKFRSFSKSKR